MKSINDTMKITNAMYLISSSKLQKARKNYMDTMPYFNALQDSINRILRHVPDMEHIYFDNRPKDKTEHEKKKGYVVVTADKGLAGAYNHNIIKLTEEQIQTAGTHYMFIVGRAGRNYFRNRQTDKKQMIAHFHYTAQNPSIHRARIISELILDWYNREALDEVYVIYTKMLNSITVVTDFVQLLPLKRIDFAKINITGLYDVYQEDICMWPTVESVIDSIVPNYVTGFLYGVLVEAFCSEQNARMMTMDAANRNGAEILKKLSISYNRVRQAAITQEISEVIGGAKVLKRKKKRLE